MSAKARDKPQPGHPDAGVQFFEHFNSVYLVPELERRAAAGRWKDGTPVFLAQVLFRLRQPPEMRINEEVRGELEAVAAGPIEKGQAVGTADMTSVTAYVLPEEDGDAAHVTVVATADGISIVLNGAYNTMLVEDYMAVIDEWIGTTRAALDRRHLRPFAENAFAATELLAKAELLSLPDDRLMRSKKHRTVQGFYNQWARLGNTEQRFADLLNRLARLRDAGRYLQAEFDLDADEAAKLMADLDAMRQHVEDVRPKRSLADKKPRAHTVIAARDITAGELITTGDFLLFR